jgi:hypothetical protein
MSIYDTQDKTLNYRLGTSVENSIKMDFKVKVGKEKDWVLQTLVRIQSKAILNIVEKPTHCTDLQHCFISYAGSYMFRQ